MLNAHYIYNYSYTRSYLLFTLLYSYMLNKNTLGVKKVLGQSEATCKQVGATKSFDISAEAKKLLNQKNFLTP